jgi:flagellar export protein FliJ
MIASDDPARLKRLLAWRRSEEEMARQEQAAALREVEAANARLQRMTDELLACRECCAMSTGGASELIDAQQCTARLGRRVEQQRAAVESARENLRATQAALAEAGRRRLAVERLAGTQALRLRDRRTAAAQADLDESGRLRLLREGD